MLCAWACYLLGVTPGPGPHIAAPQLAVVQLATPLLLLDADLRVLLGRSRRLGAAFGLASAGTLAGCVLAFVLLGPQLKWACATLGGAEEAWKLAAALCAKNIGGGLNYVAVSATTGLGPSAFAAGLVIDNAFGLLYFPLVSWLGRGQREEGAGQAEAQRAAPPTLEHSLSALALSCAVVAASRALSPANALPIATLLTVCAATAAPAALSQLVPAAELLGSSLLYLFFATAGASAGDPGRAAAYFPFFGFLGILYAVHLGIVLLGGRAARFSDPELLLASNAAIGGPATAAALAEGQGWPSLRTPAILAGNLGNAVATFASLALGYGLLSKL